MRVTKKTLRDAAVRLTLLTERNLIVESSNGKHRLCEQDVKGCRNVSPLLPSAQLLDWMDAYEKGFEQGKSVMLARFEEVQQKFTDLIRKF